MKAAAKTKSKPESKAKPKSKTPSKPLSKAARKAPPSNWKGAAKSKDNAEKKTKSIGGSSHTYSGMVVKAIANLHKRGGSSYKAIEKAMKEAHPSKEIGHKYVMRALKSLIEEGLVQKDGYKYKLTDKAKRTHSTTVTTKRSPKMSKRVKDPNAPKRPMSAFMFYSQDHREQVKKDNPDAAFGEIAKLIGEKWKGLTAQAKKKYEEQAKKDKERYEKEKEEYVPPAGSEAAKKATKEKRKPSAYNLFVAEQVPKVRDANPAMSNPEVLKEVAAMWKKEKGGKKTEKPKATKQTGGTAPRKQAAKPKTQDDAEKPKSRGKK